MKNVLEGLGEYFMLLGSLFAKPEKLSMYWRETMRQMYDIGIGSFNIIAVVATFIGAVSGVQYAYKMIALGTVPLWWIGGMVRDSVILEFAPTVTALLLAGKVGSNIASELGNMRISEQIDAMDIMGVNTRGYLVGPRVLGSLIIVPPLIVFAMILGIVGGWGACVLGGFITTQEYMKGLTEGFTPHYLNVMMAKSVIFGFLISSISCYKGFYAKGGSVELGASSTQAVVISSIAVIVANFIIAFVLL